MPINYIDVSGKDISDLADSIENVVEGYQVPVVVLACLSIAILAVYPDVPPDKLKETVQSLSEVMNASLFSERLN